MRAFFSLLVFASSMLAAQTASECGPPYLRNYTIRDYNAGTQNWAVVQDHRGIMYFGNNSGILEYDGVQWRLIATPNHTVVRSLAVDDSGRIWVGTKSDFGFLAPDSSGHLAFVSLLDSVPIPFRDFSDVWDIWVTPDGIYFNAYKSLFRWANNNITAWRPTTQFHRCFYVHNRLFIRQINVGLMTLQRDSLVPAQELHSIAQETVYFMIPYDSSDILIGTRASGLFISDGKRTRPFTTEADEFLKKNQMYHAAALADGSFAIGTLRGGVVIIEKNGRIRETLNQFTGLQDDGVYYLYTDRQQSLWLGLSNGIAHVETPSSLSHFGESSGISGTALSMERHRGRFFVSTVNGVFVLKPRDGIEPPRFIRAAPIATEAWYLLSTGDRLLAACSDGVYQIDDGSAKLVRKGVSLVLHRSRLDDRRVYIGMVDGLASIYFNNGSWMDEGTWPGISAEVRTMAESSSGTLWLGTSYRGVIRIDRPRQADQRIHFYDTRHGLSSGYVHVFPIDDREIFASRRNTYRFDTTTESFHPDTTLGKDFAEGKKLIYTLRQDRSGNAWMLSGDSLSEEKVTIEFLRRQSDGTYRRAPSDITRIPSSAKYSIYCDSAGPVWFAGSEGVTRFNPAVSRFGSTDFSTLIRRVRVGSDSVIFGGHTVSSMYVLPYRANAMRIDFSAASYAAESENEYQFLLDGFDESWSAWTRETKKDYTNIPEGSYTFRVRARNVFGDRGGEDRFAFTVLPPWYRSWWMIAIDIGAVFLAGFLLYKWRVRRLRKANVILERLVQERTQALEEKNAELKSLNAKKNEFLGIAAHDLRSPLGALLNYTKLIHSDLESGNLDPYDFRDDLTSMLKAIERMNNMVHALLDISAIESGKVNLHCNTENLNSLLEECEKLHRRTAAQKKIELVVDKNDHLPPVLIDRERVVEVVDNLVGNAIKYTQPGGTVRVFCEVSNDEVVTNVQDTGQGLYEDEIQIVFDGLRRLSATPTAGESTTGLGLAIVRKIVELHGGRVWARSRKGEGSTFSFSIPVQNSPHPAPGSGASSNSR